MISFEVHVIGFNVDTFITRYAWYIKSWTRSWYDGRIFNLIAPQEVYNEIDSLTEECIEILK
jgi:hypothetical protein